MIVAAPEPSHSSVKMPMAHRCHGVLLFALSLVIESSALAFGPRLADPRGRVGLGFGRQTFRARPAMNPRGSATPDVLLGQPINVVSEGFVERDERVAALAEHREQLRHQV